MPLAIRDFFSYIPTNLLTYVSQILISLRAKARPVLHA